MVLFGIILVLVVVSAIITNQQIEKASQRQGIAGRIAQGANELSYLGNDYLIYRESQQLKRWQSKFASFSALVASLRADRPEQQTLINNIRANQGRLKEVFDSVRSAPEGPARNQRTAFEPAFLQVSWSRMAVQSQGLVSDASRLEQLLHQQMDRLTNTRTMLIYVMVGLFGAFLLASYMLTYQRILKSLATLQASTAVIGSGNLDLVIKEKKNDEIGDLSHAFNQMTANLKGVTASKADLEREILERKRAEERLGEAHERALWLARFPEQNPNPVVRVSSDGSVLYCNAASAKHQGWKCEVGQLLQDELLPLFGQAMAEAKELQWDVQIEGRTYFIWITPFPEESYANIYGRDITERKRAEDALQQRTLELQQLTETLEQRVQERTEELEALNEELRSQIDECQRIEADLRKSQTDLRQLSIALLNAQEKERKLIAGEIHDSLGTSLAATKFKLETTIKEMGDDNPQASAALGSVIPIIQETIEEARRIQMSLRPSILDDLGILATINWFCRQFESTYSNIRIRREIEIEELEVPDALKIVIYRVLQEALNNIAKHSKAAVVLLFFRRAGQAIELVIRDSGQGFDLSEAQSRKDSSRGLGLDSMKERIELSGGSFLIESNKGKGTVIRASWRL
jgi:signal transduction histidine kinase/HAMP domain-containing protein